MVMTGDIHVQEAFLYVGDLTSGLTIVMKTKELKGKAKAIFKDLFYPACTNGIQPYQNLSQQGNLQQQEKRLTPSILDEGYF